MMILPPIIAWVIEKPRPIITVMLPRHKSRFPNSYLAVPLPLL